VEVRIGNGGALTCRAVDDGGYDFFVYTNMGGALQTNFCP
jgi:hypothetical protein